MAIIIGILVHAVMATEIQVLHIDDEPGFLALTADYLEYTDDRISVESVTSSDEAVGILSAREFDCIISDYDMPGMEGIELLEIVREKYPDVPFILFTGKGSEDIASEAISAGVSDYLQKGGAERFEILANRIDNLVERAESVSTLRRFQQIAEAAGNAISFTDSDRVIEYVNPAFVDITGYSAEEAIGETFDILNSGKMPAGYYDDLWETLNDGGSWEDEVINCRKSGEVYYAFQTIAPVTNEEGDIEAYVTIQSDITERKQQESEIQQKEKKLRERTELYDTVVEESNDGIRIVQDGRVIFANSRMGEMVGRPQDELIGEKLEEIIHPDYETKIRTFHSRRWRGEDPPQQYEVRLATSTGDERWAELSVSRVTIDGEPASLTIFRDITARKERDRDLQIAHAQLENALNAGAIGTWEWSIPEDHIVAGREFSRAFGVDPGMAERGLEIADFVSSIHETDRERVENEIEAAMETCDEYETEYRVWDANDELRWILARGYVECDEEGHPVKFPGVIVDITDRKDMEHKLEQQNKYLNEFASVVSHDIRNPLSVAKGRVALASDECDSSHLVAVAEALDRIEELIGNLLTLARQGQPEGELDTCILADFVETCWSNVNTKDATIVSAIDGTIQMDHNRLQQLLENIFRNAVEHGGDDVTVTVGPLPNGFYVANDGPGIPPDKREKFSNLDTQRTSRVPESGSRSSSRSSMSMGGKSTCGRVNRAGRDSRF